MGKHIVQALVDEGFKVTILSRTVRPENVPQGVAVKAVDYEDLESLKSALAGEDAVVSVLGAPALGAQQQKLADASVAAGVKRFIPSEFGLNTRKLEGDVLAKILGGKIKFVDDLTVKSEQNPNFTWTGVSTGMFFDFLGFDPKSKTVSITDSGNEPFQTSTREFIGKAVAAILKHPKETANQYLTIASVQPTQNEILKILEEETGSKWTVTHQDSKELQKIGEEKLSQGDFTAFFSLGAAHLYGDGVGHALKDSEKANKLLGLPEKGDLRDIVRKTYLA